MNLLAFVSCACLALPAIQAQSTASATAITTLVQTALPTTVPVTIPETVSANGTTFVSSVATGVVFSKTTTIAETITFSPTSTASSSAASSSASAAPSVHLDTRINGAFAATGVILILSGLPMAFWGHKNRWSSFFLIGFYTFSLTCIVLIIRFGVLQGVKPPSTKLEGLFLLASAVAGIIGGAAFIFFWKGTRYAVGAWGGFAVGLFIQCFHNGGVIKPIGFRWFLYIAFAAIGFVLCTLEKLHYPVLLGSTAAVGATSFILGVDCFSTAGLKEFYVYNLGFDSLFPTFTQHDPPIAFPVSQTMMIELGLIAAVTLMGTAVQMKFLAVLQRKLREITHMERERQRKLEEQAAKRFEGEEEERARWEKAHGRTDLEASLADKERPSSQLKPVDLEAGLSSSSGPATPAMPAIPTLDFGGKATSVELSGGMASPTSLVDEDPEIQSKLKLLDEIRKVKANIEAMRDDRSTSPTPTSYTLSGQTRSRTNSRPLSTASMPIQIPDGQPRAPTLSNPTQPTPSAETPLRPPRAAHPRTRTRSFDAAVNLRTVREGELDLSLKLPEDPAKMHWDEYTKDRTLFTPPTGVSAPIPTSDIVVPASAAVAEALDRRRTMEALVQGRPISSESAYLAPLPAGEGSTPSPSKNQFRASYSWLQPDKSELFHKRESSSAGMIIPDRPKPKPKPQAATPSPPPISAGELDERHRRRIKALQEPLTKQEAEQVQLAQAKKQWDRRQAAERRDMEDREKMAALAKSKRESVQPSGSRRNSRDDRVDKVADWRRSQQVPAEASPAGPSSSRSRASVERSRSSTPQSNDLPPPSRPLGSGNERRLSSLSLDAWNSFSSPGSQPPPSQSRRSSYRPPPN